MLNDIAVMQTQLDELEVTTKAITDYQSVEGYQSLLWSRYRQWYFYYSPLNADQWPEDLVARPGQIHITSNIVAPFVDVAARIQSLLPRVSLIPNGTDDLSREQAEAVEKLMISYLEMSEWEVWLGVVCRVKGIFGKTFLKPYWIDDEKRPDVSVIENPGNLRVGWGSSDYGVIDWALYEYAVSPVEAMRMFPEIEIQQRDRGQPPLVLRVGSSHDDPLGTVSPVNTSGTASPSSWNQRAMPILLSDYELNQVPIWDYWYKDEKGGVHNARFVNRVLAEPISDHPEYPDVPYILVENDHVPGSPDGRGDVEPMIDLQIELNRALSHFAQLVNDEVDPAYQLTGDNADSVPAGMVPRGGEIVAAGSGNSIGAIAKGVNQMPIDQLITTIMDQAHRNTGLPEILFAQPPGAQTAARSLAVQIESAANRIDPRRRNLYRSLRRLLFFWQYMIEQKNPKINVTDGKGGSQEVGLKDIVQGFKRWKFVAPEITPQDDTEHTTNTLNKLQGKLISLETAMDEVGVDSPLAEIMRIEAERTNAKLFPGDAQATAAVMNLILNMMPQLQQLGLTPQALGLGTSAAGGFNLGGTPPGANPLQQAQAAQGQQQLAAQQAAPQGIEAQNGPQPMSQPGSPPPPGGPPPGGPLGPVGAQGAPISGAPPNTTPLLPGGIQNQTLIRSQPNGGDKAMQQIKLVTR